MAEKEKQIARTIEAALSELPDEKKQYFIGFAEGLAAMAEQVRSKTYETAMSA